MISSFYYISLAKFFSLSLFSINVDKLFSSVFEKTEFGVKRTTCNMGRSPEELKGRKDVAGKPVSMHYREEGDTRCIFWAFHPSSALVLQL